jgi:hypothetical protein
VKESQYPRKQAEPAASHPYIPDYGPHETSDSRNLLPWSWAAERLGKAHNYWIATTQPDGRPHMTPVWGIWLEAVFYFSTGPRSRKARNLAVNPHCVVSAEHADQAVIVEGVAQRVIHPALLKQIAEVYSAKYQWHTEPTQDGVRDEHGNEGPVIAIRPSVVFAWDKFPQDATRWNFKTE